MERRARLDGNAYFGPYVPDSTAREAIGRRHLDVREVLVVPQADVEARPVLLDEIVHEDQGLDLGARDDVLEVVDLVQEGVRLGGLPGARLLEVRPDAALERARLADVD